MIARQPLPKTSVYVNAYDVKQLVDKNDEDVCIACILPYTTRGDGMLCPACRNLLKNHMGELE